MTTAKLAALAFVLLGACDYDKYSPGLDAEPVAPFPTRSEADRAFIDDMVPHHEGAVEMARIALRRAQHPELKRWPSP